MVTIAKTGADSLAPLAPVGTTPLASATNAYNAFQQVYQGLGLARDAVHPNNIGNQSAEAATKLETLKNAIAKLNPVERASLSKTMNVAFPEIYVANSAKGILATLGQRVDRETAAVEAKKLIGPHVLRKAIDIDIAATDNWLFQLTKGTATVYNKLYGISKDVRYSTGSGLTKFGLQLATFGGQLSKMAHTIQNKYSYALERTFTGPAGHKIGAVHGAEWGGSMDYPNIPGKGYFAGYAGADEARNLRDMWETAWRKAVNQDGKFSASNLSAMPNGAQRVDHEGNSIGFRRVRADLGQAGFIYYFRGTAKYDTHDSLYDDVSMHMYMKPMTSLANLPHDFNWFVNGNVNISPKSLPNLPDPQSAPTNKG